MLGQFLSLEEFLNRPGLKGRIIVQYWSENDIDVGRINYLKRCQLSVVLNAGGLGKFNPRTNSIAEDKEAREWEDDFSSNCTFLYIEALGLYVLLNSSFVPTIMSIILPPSAEEELASKIANFPKTVNV